MRRNGATIFALALCTLVSPRIAAATPLQREHARLGKQLVAAHTNILRTVKSRMDAMTSDQQHELLFSAYPSGLCDGVGRFTHIYSDGYLEFTERSCEDDQTVARTPYKDLRRENAWLRARIAKLRRALRAPTSALLPYLSDSERFYTVVSTIWLTLTTAGCSNFVIYQTHYSSGDGWSSYGFDAGASCP